MDALWCSVPVNIVCDAGEYVTVTFLRKCSHFAKGRVITLSKCNVVRRTPVFNRSPVVAVVRLSSRVGGEVSEIGRNL